MKGLLVTITIVVSFVAGFFTHAALRPAPAPAPKTVAAPVVPKPDNAVARAEPALAWNEPDSVLGVPWGASQSETLKVMMKRFKDYSGPANMRDVYTSDTFKPECPQANMCLITAVQISRDPPGGSCDFLGILDEIGQGRDQVSEFCCPDYPRSNTACEAVRTVGEPSNG
jgi:hypothetical protein